MFLPLCLLELERQAPSCPVKICQDSLTQKYEASRHLKDPCRNVLEWEHIGTQGNIEKPVKI